MGKLSYIYVDLLQESGSPAAVYLLLLSHAFSVDVLTEILPPFPHHNPTTSLLFSVSNGMLTPLPSSADFTPPPNEYLLPGRGGIPSQPSSLHFSASQIYQTDQSWCRTPSEAIPDLLILSGHRPRKKALRCHPSLLRPSFTPVLSSTNEAHCRTTASTTT